MLNKIIVMGRLTRDPELRQTPAGVSVVSASIACDRDFKDKQTGEKQTDFLDIVAWRATAEFLARHFTKGRMILVEGRLHIRTWQDQNGNNRRTAEIVADNVYFGDAKPGGQGAQTGGYNGEYRQEYEALGGDDGDLPF